MAILKNWNAVFQTTQGIRTSKNFKGFKTIFGFGPSELNVYHPSARRTFVTPRYKRFERLLWALRDGLDMTSR